MLGEPARIKAVAEDLKISLEGVRIINPAASEDLENFASRLYRVRREKGLRQTRGALSGPAGAAIRLGLKRTTLQYKMQRLGISRADFLP